MLKRALDGFKEGFREGLDLNPDRSRDKRVLEHVIEVDNLEKSLNKNKPTSKFELTANGKSVQIELAEDLWVRDNNLIKYLRLKLKALFGGDPARVSNTDDIIRVFKPQIDVLLKKSLVVSRAKVIELLTKASNGYFLIIKEVEPSDSSIQDNADGLEADLVSNPDKSQDNISTDVEGISTKATVTVNGEAYNLSDLTTSQKRDLFKSVDQQLRTRLIASIINYNKGTKYPLIEFVKENMVALKDAGITFDNLDDTGEKEGDENITPEEGGVQEKPENIELQYLYSGFEHWDGRQDLLRAIWKIELGDKYEPVTNFLHNLSVISDFIQNILTFKTSREQRDDTFKFVTGLNMIFPDTVTQDQMDLFLDVLGASESKFTALSTQELDELKQRAIATIQELDKKIREMKVRDGFTVADALNMPNSISEKYTPVAKRGYIITELNNKIYRYSTELTQLKKGLSDESLPENNRLQITQQANSLSQLIEEHNAEFATQNRIFRDSIGQINPQTSSTPSLLGPYYTALNRGTEQAINIFNTCLSSPEYTQLSPDSPQGQELREKYSSKVLKELQGKIFPIELTIAHYETTNQPPDVVANNVSGPSAQKDQQDSVKAEFR